MRAGRVKRSFLGPSNRRVRRPGREGRIRSGGKAAWSALRLAVRPLLMLAALGAVVAGGVFAARWLSTSPHFIVRHLRIEGTRHAGEDELRRRIGLDPATNIFRARMRDIARDVQSHPWVQSADAHRELPDTIVVEVVEHEPRAVVSMGHLYLANAEGRLFKRVLPGEAKGLVIVTGIDRVGYLEDRADAEARIREALAALDAYRRPGRPRLSEIALDPGAGLTLYTYTGAMQIRLGTAPIHEALRKLDVVLAALGPDLGRARTIYVDGAAQRVAVRLTPDVEPVPDPQP